MNLTDLNVNIQIASGDPRLSPTSLNHLTVHSISSDLQDRPLLDMVRGLNWAEKNVHGSLSRMLQWQLYVTCMNATMASVVHLASNSFPAFFLVCQLSCLRRDWLGICPQSFVPSWDMMQQYLSVYPMNVPGSLGK